MQASRSVALLKRLIAFPTVSRTSNLELIEFVVAQLHGAGIESTIVHSEDGKCANLFASVGPQHVPGIVLSGHTDVVPVAGQAWSSPAFEPREAEGRLYGRGSSDMKGFVACAINAMINAAGRTLSRPLQIALSYDEELGCVGVRRLLDVLEQLPLQPHMCVVGEPTMMQIATGHKGKAFYRAVCCGQEGHTALAPTCVNALHVATDLVMAARHTQQELATAGAQDAAYDIPYTTVHVSAINGGKVANIVPNHCAVDFEIRSLAADDPQKILGTILEKTERSADAQTRAAGMALPSVELINAYPGLDTHPTSDAVRFLEELLPAGTARLKVAFGTEGGLFTTRLNTPVLVCGPGSIDVAHKPDEYVELTQLAACDAFLAALVEKIAV